jgi:hypothetical protein
MRAVASARLVLLLVPSVLSYAACVVRQPSEQAAVSHALGVLCVNAPSGLAHRHVGRILSDIAYARATSTILEGGALERAVADALAGASVRTLARDYGLSRASAAGLATWAPQLVELLLGLREAEPARAGGEIVPRQTAPEQAARPSAAPQPKTECPEPEQIEKKIGVVPTPPAPAVDAFEDVPLEFRTPELARIYRETLIAHTRSAQ